MLNLFVVEPCVGEPFALDLRATLTRKLPRTSPNLMPSRRPPALQTVLLFAENIQITGRAEQILFLSENSARAQGGGTSKNIELLPPSVEYCCISIFRNRYFLPVPVILLFHPSAHQNVLSQRWRAKLLIDLSNIFPTLCLQSWFFIFHRRL